MSFATDLSRIWRSWAPLARSAGRVSEPETVASVPTATDPEARDLVEDDLLEEIEAAGPGAPAAGFADLQVAVELVASGVATRIVLSGFPSRPGLFWEAHELAEEAGVVILSTSSLDEGRVELIVSRRADRGG